MDRAYSGDTLIWCKTCPVVRSWGDVVLQDEGIVAGEDYIIGYKTYDASAYLTTGGTMNSVGIIYDDALILHADANYPPIFHSECDGYVTDLGGSFGLHRNNTPGRMLDYGFYFGTKEPLATFIAYDWSLYRPAMNVIITPGRYIMQCYQGERKEVGFDFSPGKENYPWMTLRLYHVKYSYQA